MKMSKDKLIPELRFPEFINEGEWEEKTIGEFAPLQRGFDLPIDTIIKGKYPVVFSNGILKFHKEFKVKGPGIVTGRSGTIGKVTFVDVDFWPHNTSLWVTDFYGNYPLFVFYYFVFIGLEQFGTGSGVPTLNRNDVHRHKILVPNPQEQQKIAACLSSLDEVIAAHSQKLELLKDHKKGLMQNLFPQEGEKVPKVRFKEFEKDGEWVEKVLSEVALYENGKAHEQDISENGNFVVVNSKFISTDGKVAKYSNSAYCLAEKGDILMVLSDIPNGRAIAKCFYIIEENKYTVNQRICKISSFDCDSLFLYYTMNRNPFFLAFDDGVKQTNLRNDDVQSFPFLIPIDRKEQQRIASCLSSLDALITAQAEKIAQLKLHKKGLMQGLFPKIND